MRILLFNYSMGASKKEHLAVLFKVEPGRLWGR
jgi:hypothetical protein